METTSSNTISTILIKTIDGDLYIDASRIIRFEADCKHTLIYLENKKEPIRSICPFKNFKEIMLPKFFLCHRSHMVNLNYLNKRGKDGRTLHLENDHSVMMSEDNIPEFLERTKHTILSNKLN